MSQASPLVRRHRASQDEFNGERSESPTLGITGLATA